MQQSQQNQITVRAFAKLNLFLDIVGIKENGYHLLEMIMQSVDVFDDITISKIKSSDIIIKCTDPSIPTDEQNIAHKACRLFLETISIDDDETDNQKQYGCLIEITKNIPHQAGMAGGSADAAGVLYGLNKLYGKPFTAVQLASLGERLGADVPFALCGGTCKVEGIGEKITKMNPLPECLILIAKPNKGISTKQAFDSFDQTFNINNNIKDNGFNNIINSIQSLNLKETAKHMFNKFEHLVPLEEVETIKKILLENGALNAVMTGSGSAVFGIFDLKDKEKAKNCERIFSYMAGLFEFVQLTCPTPKGVILLS